MYQSERVFQILFLGSFPRIGDRFGHTVKLDVLPMADDLSSSSHRYVAGFRELLKSGDAVSKEMHYVTLWLVEQAMSDDFYTLLAPDLRW